MAILKKKKAAKKKINEKEIVDTTTFTVDLDKLAKDSETTANATDYQAYLRNRMKGVKLA